MTAFKRLISAVLAVIIIMSLSFMAAADEAWPDITGHKYESYILKALEKGYISGYGDGTVRPDREITKKEAVTIIVKNLVANPEALSNGSRTQNIVNKAMNWGVINSGNNMSASIDRMKAYTMLAAAAGIGDGEDDSVIDSLADSKYITGEERGQIAGLINRGIISASSGALGVFKTVTRAEFIMLFMKMDAAGLWTAAKADLNNTSISKVKLSFEHSERLTEGEPMQVTVNITGGKRGTECTAVWYKNGVEEGRENIVLSGREHKYTFEIDYVMSNYTPDSVVIGFELYHDENGKQEKKGDHFTQYIDHDYKSVVAKISNKYEGDYTLQYALDHDYTDYEKSVFVNYKGYSSSTEYLIWVNRAYQRTNVYIGSKGHWKLIKVFVVGTGRPGSVTPVGVFKVFGKQSGWYKTKYDVKPIVNFYQGGYAFHSRLLYHGTDEVKDPSIGFPVSLGCMRMYNEDIQWMYDNIPIWTTVVVW